LKCADYENGRNTYTVVQLQICEISVEGASPEQISEGREVVGGGQKTSGYARQNKIKLTSLLLYKSHYLAKSQMTTKRNWQQ